MPQPELQCPSLWTGGWALLPQTSRLRLLRCFPLDYRPSTAIFLGCWVQFCLEVSAQLGRPFPAL